MVKLHKFLKENSLGVFLLIGLAFYVIFVFTKYIKSKNMSSSGHEMMHGEMASVYQNGENTMSPIERTTMLQERDSNMLSGNFGTIKDPSDLLPKDMNSEWTNNHPSGKGNLENINLLKAGYHIGIDTIGQTLKNANRQIRSEPPNPRINVGPWHNSTITGDHMRIPLEIGTC